jgi:hypothetical protein
MTEIDQLRADLASAREEIARLRGALEDMVCWFGHPGKEDYLNPSAHKMACEVADRARAALATPSEEKR